MIGWGVEFGGSFLIALVSLLIAAYYVPQSPLVLGLISAATVFFIVTPLLYIGEKPLLNPASTFVAGAQGKIGVLTVLSYIVAQLLGFFAGYVVFTLFMSSRR